MTNTPPRVLALSPRRGYQSGQLLAGVLSWVTYLLAGAEREVGEGVERTEQHV